MQKTFVPQTVIPGVSRRVDPETLLAMSDNDGRPLWNMPAPVRYEEHKKWRRHTRTGARIAEPIMVPVYRGTSTSYARWVKAQLRRNRRKAAEVEAALAAAKEAEDTATQDADAALANLILNPGGHQNVGV